MHRRTFLKLLSGLPAVGWLPDTLAANSRFQGRVLVLVELNGGNDGLNTAIPYNDPNYYTLRPNLAVARDQVMQLDPNLGLNPSLEALWSTWEHNELAVVQGVGYPQPDFSHFRSIDIWNTASDSQELLTRGWLARVLEQHRPTLKVSMDGVSLGRNLGPLYSSKSSIAMKNPTQFVRQEKRLRDLQAGTDNPALKHILQVQQQAKASAQALALHLKDASPLPAAFPKSPLSRQLETTAKAIVSGLPAASFVVSHGSFDTHQRQRRQHDRLLRQLAEALAVFRDNLVRTGHWHRVLVMTYSEFGRRPAENGSLGTDHGTAAPHFVLGGGVRGGLYGRQPALTDLDNGNLRFNVDYRSLYATAVQRWWGLPGAVFDGRFAPLDFIRTAQRT